MGNPDSLAESRIIIRKSGDKYGLEGTGHGQFEANHSDLRKTATYRFAIWVHLKVDRTTREGGALVLADVHPELERDVVFEDESRAEW